MPGCKPWHGCGSKYITFLSFLFLFTQGDLFSGLNDGLLSRAEALAAVDRNQNSHAAHQQMTQQLKHDVMYHHGMGGPPQRPLQVRATQSKSPF